MKTYKRIISFVLLAVLVGGLFPLPAHAAGRITLPDFGEIFNKSASKNYLDTPDGTVNSHEFNGENIDLYLDSIRNFEPIDGVYTSINNHTNRYADRLIGLTALCMNGEELDEYSTVIGIGMADTSFTKYHGTTSVTVGKNKVKFDLNKPESARILHLKSMQTHHVEKYSALSRTVVEYIYYADTWRKAVNEYMSNHDGTIKSTDVSVLEELHRAYLFACNGDVPGYAPNLQFMIDLWNVKGEPGDLGLSELYEYSKDVTKIYTDNVFGDVTVETGQPLKNFYVVNSDSGIGNVNVSKLSSAQGEVSTPELVETESSVSRGYVTIGENIIRGTGYSAGYIPLQTNVYNTSTINSYDSTWLTDWHYKYGFMRKALFKDTSATSAMDHYNSLGSTRGSLSVCTLRDFLELGENDLTLYIDQSFYNADKANTMWSSIREEEMLKINQFIADLNTYLDKSYGKDETDEDYEQVDVNFINEAYDIDLTTMSKKEIKKLIASLKKQRTNMGNEIDFSAIVKTEEYTEYSNKLRGHVVTADGNFIENSVKSWLNLNNHDSLVLSSYDISDILDAQTTRNETGSVESLTDYEYTSYDEYSPMFSFSYVSALYRDKSAYSVSTLNELGSPVFIASDDVAQVLDASMHDRSSLLNYMLVRNLPSMVQINYTYSIDMDSPVYMDIYGNILTESGLVVIPAASNATLYPDDYNSSMYQVGIYSCYGNDWRVPGDYKNVEELLSPFFKLDKENNVWVTDGKGVEVNGTLVDFANIAAYVSSTQEALASAFIDYIYTEDADGDHKSTHLIWTKWIDIINEVMRGAPLEHINRSTEGLSTNSTINKTSIVAAAKLESLIKSLQGTMSNTLINIPDFTSLEQSEYVIAFAFKIVLVLVTFVILIHIYRDAVSANLGFRTFFKCAGAIGLTFLCITIIPAVFQLTYYAANKLLLQNEVTKICMYNLEKKQSGIEIGITESIVPNTSNKLMVQLDWIDIPWYLEIEELLFGNSVDTIDIAKESAKSKSTIANTPDVQFLNDGVYMDVNDIFNSVGMDFTFNVGELKDSSDTVNGLYLYNNDTNQSLSYYSPYYVFLKALTANVNSYNKSHNSYMYTTKLQSGNRLKTVGLSEQYFTSENFMELDPDILHLYEVYGLQKESWYDNGLLFYADEVDSMRQSLWYNNLDKENVQKRLNIVNNYCRDFIAENKGLLDKITDETFIKVMSLSMAMKYNQVFGITEANCFEIFNMDSNDLLRLSVATTEDAMLTSPMSYPRFVLTTGGESAVYAASVLTMVMFVGSFIKPACIIVAYISVFASIFVFRVVLRRKSNSLLGYLITVLLLGGTNFLHAIILKISTYLPKTGISVLGAICAIIVFQVVYLVVLSYVTSIALRDWQHLGADKYEETYHNIKAKLGGKNSNPLSSSVPRYEDNWDYYNSLVEQHRERNNNI